MKMGQHMKLAPRMIQSMEILQMPLAELEERIEQELENNPTLEIAEGTGEGLDQTGRALSEQREEWERPQRVRKSQDGSDKSAAMAQAPAKAESLTEQLLHQWSLVDVDERTRHLGETIVSFLDADGYLRTAPNVIAERSPGDRATSAEYEHALQAVQLLLEPAGVAARDSRECLLLQLDAWSEREDAPDPSTIQHARRLIGEHIEDLMKNRLPRVAEATGFTLPEIKAALELMRRLSLHPAKQLIDDTAAGIVPDAIVEYEPDGDRYLVYLNDTRLPNLRVNQEYAKLAKDKTLVLRDRDFVRTNLGNAQWLLDAVNQRRNTLLRVVQAVVAAQRDYFDQGAQALKPLPMSQIADLLGVHVATISRAVSEKYIATPRGVVALRKFFSGGLSTRGDAENTSEDMAWEAIKISLKDLIEAEDKHKPLSDDALGAELKKRGIDIARRTVAKYRDQLGIPPARLRRVY